jgi:hypothetical protein
MDKNPAVLLRFVLTTQTLPFSVQIEQIILLEMSPM